METRTAITSMGCLTPYGKGVEHFWACLSKGETAFRPITLFDASGFRNELAGQVPDDCAPKEGPRALSFLTAAVEEAVSSAKLENTDPSRIGISLGTNFGCAEYGLNALKSGKASLHQASLDAGAQAVRSALDCQGPTDVQSLACASGAAAIGSASRMIQRGQADAVVAGGFDELSLHAYVGLNNLRAISKSRILPFHARRSGTLFSEGAGILILESEAHAHSRGAPILAYLEGYAVNNDAFHMTAPDKTGKGITRVMEEALKASGKLPQDIGYINCHGTGTVYNDMIETRAIKMAFQEHAHALSLTSNKSCIGHTMGAAGALEAIATVQTLRTGLIPPTAGLDEPDPELDLNYTPIKACPRAVTLALSNSYGLGGTNTSLVLSRASAS